MRGHRNIKKVLCSSDGNPLSATQIEKYIIIDKLKTEFPVQRICKILNIKRRSYYKWVAQGRTISNNLNYGHLKIISEEHLNNKQVYGTIRLKIHIEKKLGIVMNHKKIIRYKRILGLTTITRKKRPLYQRQKKKESQGYMAPNLLNCNFASPIALTKLSTDVSYINCTDGRLYLSAVKDLFNNKIIAHFVSDKNDTELTIKTLNQLEKGNGIMHSDQGALYYSGEYINKIGELGYARSMSNKGCCWENSPIENWFSQLKEEHLRPIGLKSKKETKKEIKKYIEWYNTQRIQKCLGYLTPEQYA